jgi:hypothetical protein
MNMNTDNYTLNIHEDFFIVASGADIQGQDHILLAETEPNREKFISDHWPQWSAIISIKNIPLPPCAACNKY